MMTKKIVIKPEQAPEIIQPVFKKDVNNFTKLSNDHVCVGEPARETPNVTTVDDLKK